MKKQAFHTILFKDKHEETGFPHYVQSTCQVCETEIQNKVIGGHPNLLPSLANYQTGLKTKEAPRHHSTADAESANAMSGSPCMLSNHPAIELCSIY